MKDCTPGLALKKRLIRANSLVAAWLAAGVLRDKIMHFDFRFTEQKRNFRATLKEIEKHAWAT